MSAIAPAGIQAVMPAIGNALGRQIRSYDYYVDSVNGNDSNSGRRPGQAFKTIAALPALVDGVRIGLARGSVWREQIGSISESSNGVYIGAYGSGKKPILDAADVISAGAWSKTVGLTNVYECTVTVPASTGNYPSLWEDSIRLRWVSSAANADAMAGSYFVATTAGGSTATYFVHATDSGNPASNGSTYEYSARFSGLNSGGDGTSTNVWVVNDIHTKRNLHNNGSLIVRGTLRRCIAEDGVKHNMFISADSTAEDCIAWKSDWADRTNSVMFIAYAPDANGKTATYRRCIAVGDATKNSVAIAAAQAIDGFYAHTDGGGGHNWAAVNHIDCVASNVTTGFGAVNCDSYDQQRCKTIDALTLCSADATTSTITDAFNHENTSFPVNAVGVTGSGSVTIDGYRSYVGENSNKGDIYFSGASTVVLNNSAFYRHTAASGYRFAINCANAGSDLTIDGIAIGSNGAGSAYGMALSGKGTLTTNNNNFYPDTVDFETSLAAYLSFSLYRTAHPEHDANSTTIDPQFVDPANGDFTIQAVGLPTGCGCTRPTISYTAVPSEAALGAM